MHFFLADEIRDDEITFEEEEVRHMLRSLRLTEGDELWVLDGLGNKYRCQLTLAGKKNARGRILDRLAFPLPEYRLHLAIAPTKNPGRLEWLIEKATELGVTEVTFLETRRSERVKVNLDRIRKIARSALKQSGNGYLPVFAEVTALNQFVGRDFAEHQCFIAHCQSGNLPHLADKVQTEQPVVVLIGPEGDFTVEETDTARQHGFTEISLGRLRLRTETAGIFVTALMAIINRHS